jgi:hypothetical protein
VGCQLIVDSRSLSRQVTSYIDEEAQGTFFVKDYSGECAPAFSNNTIHEASLKNM